MKFPDAVRASEGSKYLLPSTEPIGFFFGCAECSATMPTTTTPTAAPQRNPICHLMRGPASRCRMYSHTARIGMRTCAQYATDRAWGFFSPTFLTEKCQTRINSNPVLKTIRLVAKSR